MGPAATADLYAKLIALTPGATDQEHPKVVIWADPTVPDRTLALTAGGPDPTPWLLRGAAVLRVAGATVLAIPCNTAHAFLPRIESQLGVPVVHMIDQVARHIHCSGPSVTRVGLLATTGTVRAGLYQRSLAEFGIEVVLPDGQVQDRQVMPGIRAVKASRAGQEVVDQLSAAARYLHHCGAQVLIAGCTEIPLVLPAGNVPCPIVDPAMVLAQTLLEHTRDS
ncbi:aspartate/glutamate racemase family protein [Nocardia brasiliensis]